MKYFHQLSETEYKQAQKLTVEQVLHQFKQPDWCNYPDALSGRMGCWSLVGGMVKAEDRCTGCDLYKGDRK